jgi:hypothetical protein
MDMILNGFPVKLLPFVDFNFFAMAIPEYQLKLLKC